MRIEFATEARDDLFEAADYYEGKELGLGYRFRDQIAEVLRVVITAPYLWRERSGGYRRVNCPVFPYYIAYVIRDDALVVVAVAHGSRQPGFWHGRLERQPSTAAGRPDQSLGGPDNEEGDGQQHGR